MLVPPKARDVTGGTEASRRFLNDLFNKAPSSECHLSAQSHYVDPVALSVLRLFRKKKRHRNAPLFLKRMDLPEKFQSRTQKTCGWFE
ncbi:uncharacterized [Tachysurus ichikawai]